MNAFEFSKEAIRLCSGFGFINGVDVVLIDEPVAKIKAVIEKDTFINIFYNAETAKYSFALIKNNQRIFGVDNTKKWHIHTFEEPESHLESGSISLLDFLKILESNKDKWYDI